MNLSQDPREFLHRIDRDGRISFVNEAWLAFAAENGWDISAAQVLGLDLMEQISDPETRHIYKLLIARARDQGRQAFFGYRCDSPDCRRIMQMRINLDRDLDQVEFRSHVLRMERRDPVALFDPGHLNRSDEILRVCSWCKAVSVDRTWIEVEQAVARLGLLAAPVLPRISHGICPDCSERMSNGGVCA